MPHTEIRTEDIPKAFGKIKEVIDQAVELNVLRLLAETTPIAVWVMDYNKDPATMLWHNDTFQEWFGRSYIGQSHYDAWATDLADEFTRDDLKILASAPAYHYAHWINPSVTHLDGRHYVIKWPIVRPPIRWIAGITFPAIPEALQ